MCVCVVMYDSSSYPPFMWRQVFITANCERVKEEGEKVETEKKAIREGRER